MTRWIRFRVRAGAGLFGPGVDLRAGDEFVVSYTDAAVLLRDKGRRAFEVLEDFESDVVPDGAVSIATPDGPPG